MKRYTTTLMFAAAALAVAAGSASAQTLKAEIPFAFRAGGVLMAPGTYTVTPQHSAGSTAYMLANKETGNGVILAHYVSADASKAWRGAGSPKLGFECAGTHCALRTLWNGTDRSAHNFLGPKPTGDEPTRMAEVRLTPLKSE